MSNSESEWTWQRGGARVHGIYLTWPFAVLRVSEHALELRVLFWRWQISASEVTAIRRISGLTTKGVEIEHTNADAPSTPVFWSVNIDALERGLRDAGYKIVSG